MTASIITTLEQGTRPWVKPWTSPQPETLSLPLRANGTPYRGINILLLWGAAFDGGFTVPQWMTYKQATAAGGQVRKGERGAMVVYADRFTTTETNERGEDLERQIPFLKAYTVFNVAQIDGLAPQSVDRPALNTEGAPQLIEVAEAFMAATGATVPHGGNRAFYAPSSDHIQLPPPLAFDDAARYSGTKAHELVHWTGHTTRLARAFGQRFGDQAYAFEELVAELGAAFLCADLGVLLQPRDDHASHLAHWLGILRDDKRAIFTAASQAQRAADHPHGLQPTPSRLATSGL